MSPSTDPLRAHSTLFLSTACAEIVSAAGLADSYMEPPSQKDGAGAGVSLGAGAGAGAGVSMPAAPAAGVLATSPFEHAASRLIEATIAIRARCVRVFFIIFLDRKSTRLNSSH